MCGSLRCTTPSIRRRADHRSPALDLCEASSHHHKHPRTRTCGAAPMSKFPLICLAASLLGAVTAASSALAAEGKQHEAAPIPNFAPDSTTAWTLNRPAHDDFLPPPSGPG